MELNLLLSYTVLLVVGTVCVHSSQESGLSLQSQLDNLKTMESPQKSDILQEIPQTDDSFLQIQTRSKLDRMPAVFGKRGSKIDRMPQYFGKRSRLNRMPAIFGKRSRLNRMPAIFGKRSKLDRMPAVFGKRSRLNRMPAIFGKRDTLIDVIPGDLEASTETFQDVTTPEIYSDAELDLLSLINSDKVTVEDLSNLVAEDVALLVPLVRSIVDKNGDGIISAGELMAIKMRQA